jgi:hypothetical protein
MLNSSISSSIAVISFVLNLESTVLKLGDKNAIAKAVSGVKNVD